MYHIISRPRRLRAVLSLGVSVIFYLLAFVVQPTWAQATGTISGTVLNNLSQPISGVEFVEVCVSVYDTRMLSCVLTAGDGSYTIAGLLAADYRVEVEASGWAHEFYANAYVWDNATRVPVAVGQTTSGINFILEPGGPISGTVWDANNQPLPEMNVGWVDDTGQGRGTCTDTNGNYTVTGVPFDFPFRVFAGGSNNWCGGPNNYKSEYWYESPDFDTATMVTLTTTNPSESGINFTLEQGGTVSGTITDQVTGLPIANVNVDTDFFGYGFGTCTDQNGNFTIGGLPLNTNFKISAGGHTGCGNPTPYAREFWQEKRFWHEAAVLRLTNTNPVDIDFTLEQAGTISGTVYEADGSTPIANMGVDVAQGGMGTCTDENGNFTLVVPFGTYKIRSGANNFCGGPNQFMNEYWPDTTDINSATEVTVDTQTPSQSGIIFRLDVGGTVSGTVTDLVTGLPIANVNVDTDFFGYGFGTCTDNSGNFTIGGLPLNTNFKISAGGHTGCGNATPYAREFWEETPFWHEGEVLSLTNTNPVDIDFTLEQAGTISGTVYEANGTTAIANMGVDIAQGGMGTCTDQNGNFTLVVPFGTYKIRSGANNFCGGPNQFMNEYWPDTTDINSATEVTVDTQTPSQSGIIFRLDVGGTVSGTVVAQGGQTLANMSVNTDFFGYGFGTCTDQNGNFTISGLPLETDFKISAGGNNWCGGANNYIQEFWQETRFWHEAIVLTLPTSTPDLAGINFTLETGGTIAGFVYDEQGTPQGGVPIDIIQGGYGRCTNGDGSFTLNGLPFDTPTIIKAGGVQWGGCPNQQFAQELYEDVFYEVDATPIIIDSQSPNVTGIVITLGGGGTISGHVTDGDTNTALSDVRVDIGIIQDFGGRIDFQSSGVGDCTDANGNYTILVPNGTYHIFAGGRCDGQTPPYAASIWSGTSYPAEADAVIVSDTQPDVTGIDFVLYPVGYVRGTVRDAATGNGIPHISVQFFFPFTGLGICTDENGQYEAQIDFHDVPFTVHSPSLVESGGPGQWPGCGNTTLYAREFWQETPFQDGATVLTITQSIREYNNVDFTLNLAGSISGTVTNTATGQPVANVWVQPTEGDPFGGTCTDAQGNYTINGVPFGSWKLQAFPGPFCGPESATDYRDEWWQEKASQAEANLIVVDQTTPNVTGINFTLEPVGSVSGTVTDAATGQPLANIQVDVVFGFTGMGECTDENGNYTISGVAMDTQFWVQAGGPYSFCGNTNYVREFWYETPDINNAALLTVTTTNVHRTNINFTLAVDTDTDGISNETEDDAPNNGDGNNDGISDSQQDNVASLPNSNDGQYVTVESPSGSSLTEVAAIDNPSPSDTPSGVDFPIGFVEYTVENLTAGSGATVTLIAPVGTTFTTYYKYGPTPDNATPHWYEFLYDGTTGAEINGSVLTLHFVDGLRGDNDLSVNGQIVDPGAPATLHYNFTGFFAPVEGEGSINVVNAGRSIPIKFSLGGNHGLDIFYLDYPSSIQVGAACTSANIIPESATVTAGNSSLSYNSSTDQYTYVWKTEKSWAGTCRQLNVRLKDGSIHMAYFLFR